MAITKTENGTYRLRMYIPEEVKSSLGISSKVVEKRFKKRSDARKFEIELLTKISNILDGGIDIPLESDGNILFSDFYTNVWWEAYKSGQTTSTAKPPTIVTIENTEIIFRKHILPLLGNYSIDFLNNNKQVILNLMTQKSREYANFKTIKSYVISIFDWAEELDYIEYNRIAKTIRRIKAIKKIQLQEEKNDSDLYLSKEELQAWFSAFQQDLEQDKLSLKDYVLFFTTFFLGNRKSESYALQWKHVNLENKEISLVQALDRKKGIKNTKGNKKTIFSIPAELTALLHS